MKTNHYRAVFISDCHLGYGRSKADRLAEFLSSHESDYLYLVGDIIDIERMERRVHWSDACAKTVRQILTKANDGVQVHYVIGNHDAALRRFLAQGLTFGNIPFSNHVCHVGVDGKRYLVIHGDQVESSTRSQMSRPLMILLQRGYVALLQLNAAFDWMLGKFNAEPFNIVGLIRKRSRKLRDYVRRYENLMAEYARERDYDGVVCGHIHSPQMRNIDGTEYRNCGDWLENCSALVEHHDGRWEIVRQEAKP